MSKSNLRGSINYCSDNVEQEELLLSHKPRPYSSNLETVEESASTVKAKGKKVCIVGCGQVGLAIAYAIINQEICSSLALVDMNGTKLEGEAKDLRQGSAFHPRLVIEASTEYDITADSDLVIVTAGAAQKPGQSRLELIGTNVKIMKAIIPQVLKYSPNATICIASNPCDICAAIAAKIAGPNIPPGRIFGSGTVLDSSRLRVLIGKTVNVDPGSVHGYIIGEHGDSSVPVFSSIRIGGIPLLGPAEVPKQRHLDLHKEVVQSAYDVINKKGYTNWAIGLAAANIAKVVVGDQMKVLPVSTCVRGMSGVEADVFLSVPCVVGASGVKRILDLPLSDNEMKQFQTSAQNLWKVQSGVWDMV